MTERTAYRLSEVRAALGISRTTLYRWIEDGKLPITKLCDRSFVKREHLEGLMEAKEQPKEASVLARLKRGFKGEYSSWENARQRCTNPNRPDYKYYGARGVLFSERWDSFQAFMTDMGPKPSPKHSLDRWPNPAGNYEPGNCRWATSKEQNSNRIIPIHVPVHVSDPD
jgi:excisionase family DNA binding protein